MSITIQRCPISNLTDTQLRFWRDTAPTPMQTPEWMLSWWRAFHSPNSVDSILTVYAEGSLIGMAPLFLRRCWTFGRVLRFLASGSAYTDHQTFLAATNHAGTVADAIANWLLSGAGARTWDLIELDGVCDQPPGMNCFVERLQQFGSIRQESTLESTWRLDLSGGWESFLGNLSRTQRSQVRNFMNRLDKSADMSFRIVSSPAEIHAALRVCQELHQKRWTSIGKSGCFADTRFSKFIQNAVSEFAARSQAAITLLEHRGLPVASQLTFKTLDGSIFVYQCGRDPAFDAARVGQILNFASIRDACDQQVPFMDYLRGDEDYKSRMRATPHVCRRIRIFAPRTIPLLRYRAWQLSKEAKSRAAAWRQMFEPSEATMQRIE